MKTKPKRQEWREEDMALALKNVREKNMGWLLASKTFKVPPSTLRRRFKNNCNSTKGDLGGVRPVFCREIEEEFVRHIREMETRFFGLTLKDLQKLIFEFANKNDIKNPFNKEKGIAGQKWIKGFLKRNPHISLRRPENTSAARAQAFNKENIAAYFKLLNNVMEKHKFTPENIYNVDESGLSTVQKRPQKVLATKGRKQVGALSSAERGQHFTVVCCMNAIGTFVPPVFIFPRKRMKNEIMDNAPIGSKAFCQENGWMCGELFVQWLKHFVHYTKASKENKVLLLLDGHNSHKCLEVLQYAKDNGVILFCFPPHCTHRVQPLDVGFFAPLQTYYGQEIQRWLKQNPGRIVSHFQVSDLFNRAYLKAATPANAINAFSKTGIYPFNENIFEDWMFQPSSTTDKPLNDEYQVQNVQEQPYHVDVDFHKHGTKSPEPTEGTSGSTEGTSGSTAANCLTSLPMEVEFLTPMSCEESKSAATGILSPKKLKYSIEELSPLPQAVPGSSKKRNRKPSKKGHINSTPDIDELKREADDKTRKEREKLSRKTKRKIVVEKEMNDGSNDGEIQDFEDDEDDVGCLYCNDLYSRSKSKEAWISCQKCRSWCHCECAGVDKRVKKFVCELCQ